MQQIAPPKIKGLKDGIVEVKAPKFPQIREKKEPVQMFYTSNSDNRITVKFTDKSFGISITADKKMTAFMQNTTTKENAIVQQVLNKIKSYIKEGLSLTEVKAKLQAGNFATSIKVFYNHITKPTPEPTT